jgi:hypothetical protein
VSVTVDSRRKIVEPACRTGTDVPAGGLVLVLTVLSGGTVEVPTVEDAVVFGGWTLPNWQDVLSWGERGLWETRCAGV